jgi:prepilin-type N-terminal cleavage/methylation domain-containing protein
MLKVLTMKPTSPLRVRPGAFTLIELLVVVGILGLLLAFLIVAVADLPLRTKGVKTRALVQGIDKACVAYREMFGAGREDPPMDRGTTQNVLTGDSSKNLYYYLGRPLTRTFGQGGGNVPVPAPQAVERLFKFTEDQLEGAGTDKVVIDLWGRRVLYYNHPGSGADPFAGPAFPGHDARHGDPRAAHVDIVSHAQSETGVDSDGEDCRIATWGKN